MVRPAGFADIPRIAEIMVFGKRTAYRPIFQDDAFSFNVLQVCSLARKLESSPQRLEDMLVYDDGIVKGVITGQNTGRAMEIRDFYVEPFFTGCGIGRALIQAAIQKAAKLQLDRIFLWVLVKNKKARSFYERNGFFTTRETQLVPGTDQLEIYYERRLDQETE